MENLSNEFEQWVNMWDKVSKTEAFDKTNKKSKTTSVYSDFFGSYNNEDPNYSPESDEVDDWNKIYNSSIESEILNESKKSKKSKKSKNDDLPIKTKRGKDDPQENFPPPAEEAKCQLDGEKYDGDTLGDVAKHLGKQANPISYPTRGKDARNHITPNFTCGKELVQLNNMKKNLYDLESKMGSLRALAKNEEAKKIAKQIKDLWVKIDELSDKLSPDFLNDYMS